MVKSIYELLEIEPYSEYEVVAAKYKEVMTNSKIDPILRKKISDETHVYVGSKTTDEYNKIRENEIEQYQREILVNNHSKASVNNSSKNFGGSDLKFKLYKKKNKSSIKNILKVSSKKVKVITATGLVAVIALSSGGLLSSYYKEFDKPNPLSSDSTFGETTYSDEDFVKSYSFNYVVQYGDTMDDLKKRFEAVNISGLDGERYGSKLPDGVTLTIVTENQDIYNKYSKMYKDSKKSEEPVSYESYFVEPGDTLPEIASQYDVTCDQIRNYNSGIVGKAPNYEIKAGTTLSIPVYEYQTSHSK